MNNNKYKLFFILTLLSILIVGIGMVSAAGISNQTDTSTSTSANVQSTTEAVNTADVTSTTVDTSSSTDTNSASSMVKTTSTSSSSSVASTNVDTSSSTDTNSVTNTVETTSTAKSNSVASTTVTTPTKDKINVNSTTSNNNLKSVINLKSSSLKTATQPVNTYDDLYNGITTAAGDTVLEINSDIILTNNITVTGNKNITINGNNHILNGNNTYQFLNITSGSTITLNNITIKNCTKKTNGGAIYNNGNLTIINSSFINNTATEIGESSFVEAFGGAIYNDGTVIITGNNTFTQNEAKTEGGVIYNTKNLTITGNNTFSQNNATYKGGVIYNSGVVTITGNNTFTQNKAYEGVGGVINNYVNGNVTITGNNTFSQNYAYEGGVIDNSYNTTIIITGTNTFIQNEGYDGGVIGTYGNMTIAGNNTFSQNIVSEFGGVICTGYSSNLTITGNNTFSQNNVYSTSDGGDGGVIYNNGRNITITGTNTFTQNSAIRFGGVIYNNMGNMTIVGNNTFSQNTAIVGGALNNYKGNITITGNNTFLQNRAIIEGGAISNNASVTMLITGTNKFTNNSAVNGGAIYILQSKLEIVENNTFYQNKADNYGGALCINPGLPSNFGPIFNSIKTSTYSNIKQGIKTIVSHDTFVCYEKILVNNVFLENNATYGGAIYNNQTNLTIMGNNTFKQNKATITGGAINDFKGNLTIIGNNSFLINSGSQGGAIYVDSVNINITDNNKFTQNNATTGGAIENLNSNVRIIGNNTFSQNNATKGGVIYNNRNEFGYGNITVENGTFINNNAVNGAVLLNLGNITFNNSYVVDNYATSPEGFVITDASNAQYIEIKNILFVNNTDNIRDMLFYNNTQWKVSNNIYIDNMLNDTVVTPLNNTVLSDTESTLDVEMQLRSIYNDTIRNGTLSFENYTNTGNIEDGNGVISYNGIKAGTVLLQYTSLSKHYQNVNINLIYILNTTTTGVINNNNPSQEISLTATVIDEKGNLVLNGTVNVYENNVFVGNGTVENGVVSIPLNLNAGDHTLFVNYTGTQYYNPSNTTVTVKIKIPTKITIDPILDIFIGDTVNITGVLTDNNNQIIPNADLTLKIDNQTVTLTTDAKGQYKYTYTTTDRGINNVVVTYPDSDIYIGCTNNTVFNVIKIPTKITINTIPDTFIGDTANITGVLTDNNNQIIPNADLTLKIDNQTVTVITDANGQYKYTYTTTDMGVNNLIIVYSGSNIYMSSSDNTLFNVIREPSYISVDAVNGIVEDGIQLNATITDKLGNPINGGIIVFKIDGQTLKYANGTPIYVNVTNGKAQLDYILTRSWIKPNIKIGAAYSGTDICTGSRAANQTINVIRRDALVDVTTLNPIIKATNTTTFTAVVTDKIRNQLVQTGIVVFKFQGHTLKDANGTTYYANITNGIATINYTAPLGISSHNYTVTAVYANLDYNRAENITKQFVNKTDITITSSAIATNTVGDNLTVTGTIKDILGNNVVGTNKIAIKINGVTVKDANNDTQFYYIKNGNINLTINNTLSQNIKNILIVTGERYAYFETRTTMTNITTIKTAKQSIKMKV